MCKEYSRQRNKYFPLFLRKTRTSPTSILYLTKWPPCCQVGGSLPVYPAAQSLIRQGKKICSALCLPLVRGSHRVQHSSSAWVASSHEKLISWSQSAVQWVCDLAFQLFRRAGREHAVWTLIERGVQEGNPKILGGHHPQMLCFHLLGSWLWKKACKALIARHKVNFKNGFDFF